MTPIKLGVIGCGIAARDLHFPALQQLKDKFVIQAVCNRTPEKARSFAELTGAPDWMLDYQQLLSREDIEAVDIALPIHLNCQVTRDALKAGKHVIVEKPLAANLKQGREMVEWEKKSGRVVVLGENFRYAEVFLKTRALLKNGAIGKVYAVLWNMIFKMDQDNKYGRTAWRLKPKYRGGFVLDGGIHNIAALRMLFGEFDWNRSFSRSVNPSIGKPDTFSLQFQMKNGPAGVFNLFFSANGFNDNRLVIFGKEGTIQLASGKILIHRKGQPDVEEPIQADGGYRAQFENFYDAIRTGKKVVSTFAEGYKDLKVLLEAIEKSD